MRINKPKDHLKPKSGFIRAAGFLAVLALVCFECIHAQDLLIMNRDDNNKLVNDSVVYVHSNDLSTQILTASFLLKNTTDSTLSLYLKRTINQLGDSTMDFFCYYTQCWFNTDSTDIPNPIPPGGVDYTFVTHVCHVRMLEAEPLRPGFSSITYILYDNQAMPLPIEEKVTVQYHLSGLGLPGQEMAPTIVYPNPASDFVFLQIKNLQQGKHLVFIRNSLGSLLSQTTAEIHDESLKINIRQLQSGVYHGVLVCPSSLAFPFRFIVHR